MIGGAAAEALAVSVEVVVAVAVVLVASVVEADSAEVEPVEAGNVSQT